MMSFDVVLVGGGLASSLVAAALRHAHPGLRIAVVERNAGLGGSHTWCFHDTDVPEGASVWLAPFVAARWSRWETRFPERGRIFEGGYNAITTASLQDAVANVLAAPGSALVSGRSATVVQADRVTLEDGTVLEGKLVFDGRGPRPGESEMAGAGFQKFVGLELELEQPSGLNQPIVMDADVPQLDGYRFFYVLPFASRHLLVEDTTFSDGPQLDVGSRTDAIRRYAEERGWAIRRVLRAERGVLAMPWVRTGTWSQEVPAIGWRGGWFHPATGYSMPVALRVAAALAEGRPADASDARAALLELGRTLAPQMRFARLLNRLLFRTIAPSGRRDIFARFHEQPEESVLRFYGLRSTRADQLRVFCRRPPKELQFGFRAASGGQPT